MPRDDEVGIYTEYSDDYVRERLQDSLKKAGVSHLSGGKRLYWCDYEAIDFEEARKRPGDVLVSAYMIRKALIRKHFLAHTVASYLAKHPNEDKLRRAVPATFQLELDYAEFLDDALTEACELQYELQQNEALEASKRSWFILKPSMADRGQGIRLFATQQELQAIFDSFEEETEEDEQDNAHGSMAIPTSDLRHFVVQEYVKRPLLVEGHKFHVRAYVVSVGAIAVYVYDQVLALLASKPYEMTGEPHHANTQLDSHLTNTCLQTDGDKAQWVRLLHELPLPDVRPDIYSVIGSVFRAAATTQRLHFQTEPNAFEIFGVDLLVSEDGVHLLEVNAYPDFAQTGAKLGHRISRLFDLVAREVVAPFFSIATDDPAAEEPGRLVKVYEESLMGNWN